MIQTSMCVCCSQAQKINGPQFFICRIRRFTTGSPLGESHGELVHSENVVGKRWALIPVWWKTLDDWRVASDHFLRLKLLGYKLYYLLYKCFWKKWSYKQPSSFDFLFFSMSSWCRQMSLWGALLIETMMRHRHNAKNDFANSFRYRMLMLGSEHSRLNLVSALHLLIIPEWIDEWWSLHWIRSWFLT